MISVLEKTCSSENRPYSKKELQYRRDNFIKMIHLSSTFIYHSECDHGYYCKIGGKKEKEFLESKGENKGNCSVCWKLYHTPRSLKKQALSLISCYLKKNLETYIKPETFLILELETDFYTWLYREFNSVS